MFHLVLIHPQIPPNTGNIIRLAANTGSVLHLIEPLGFSLHEKKLRSAGLDYHDMVQTKLYPSFESFISYHLNEIKTKFPSSKLLFFSTKGKQSYVDVKFRTGDCLIFGSETKGINEAVLKQYQSQVYKIPMMPNNRSLNLSNAVAIVLYEALRQNHFSNF